MIELQITINKQCYFKNKDLGRHYQEKICKHSTNVKVIIISNQKDNANQNYR